jgi:hypothetical protein
VRCSIERCFTLWVLETTNVFVIKRIFIVILSFLILSSAFANFCWATPSLLSGADQAPDLKDQNHSQQHHEQSPDNNEVPCYKGQLCCPWITQGTSTYHFVLRSYLTTPLEISFQPQEIVKSLYHPPEVPLSSFSPFTIAGSRS